MKTTTPAPIRWRLSLAFYQLPAFAGAALAGPVWQRPSNSGHEATREALPGNHYFLRAQ